MESFDYTLESNGNTFDFHFDGADTLKVLNVEKQLSFILRTSWNLTSSGLHSGIPFKKIVEYLHLLSQNKSNPSIKLDFEICYRIQYYLKMTVAVKDPFGDDKNSRGYSYETYASNTTDFPGLTHESTIQVPKSESAKN